MKEESPAGFYLFGNTVGFNKLFKIKKTNPYLCKIDLILYLLKKFFKFLSASES